MIFVDSNVRMYLVGAAHPLKAAARTHLEEAISRGDRLVTSAEVMQEILHRYVAIHRHDAIRPALDALHVAVLSRRRVKRILSFDSGFDGAPGIERIGGRGGPEAGTDQVRTSAERYRGK